VDVEAIYQDSIMVLFFSARRFAFTQMLESIFRMRKGEKHKFIHHDLNDKTRIKYPKVLDTGVDVICKRC
jgi:hypothetical protein